MANRSNASRGLRDDEHYNTGNGRVFVKAPPGYPGKKYIKDPWHPEGRYVYRYQAEAFKKTGRAADPKREIVHHTTEAHDTGRFSRSMDAHVAIQSRKQHYKHGHGRPFSRPKGTPSRKFR